MSRQEIDQVRRIAEKRLPKDYVIYNVAYSKKLDHAYVLGKHFRKEEFVFFQSTNKKMYRFLEYDLMMLMDLFFNVDQEQDMEICGSCKTGDIKNYIG